MQAAEAMLCKDIQSSLTPLPRHIAPAWRPSRFQRYARIVRGMLSLIFKTSWMKTPGVEHARCETEHAVGVLGGPENVYKDSKKDVVDQINNLFPASKGEVQASDAKLEAEFEEYKNETTSVINGLVVVVNSLTPVGG